MATAINDATLDFYWKYAIDRSFTEILQQTIGSSVSLAAGSILSHDDTTSLYVSWAGSDGSSGDGTRAAPYRTINYAIDNIGVSGIKIITILDSNYYYCNDATHTTITLNGISLQGEIGTSPSIKIDNGYASCVNMITMTKNGSNRSGLYNVRLVPVTYATQFNGINILDGIIKYVSVDGMTKCGVIAGTGTVTTVNIDYCVIKNSINGATSDGSGIYIDDGTWSINRTLIYGCAFASMHIAGTSNKTVTINYATIADNFYGIHSNSSTNESITVNNSILYNNLVYDYYGITGTLHYCCVGAINGITQDANMSGTKIRFNPLFVGSADYRLRTIHNGYATDELSSMCVGTSTDNKDLGCYDYSRTIAYSDGIDFYTNRSDIFRKTIRNVDSKKYTSKTGKTFEYVRAVEKLLEISWQHLSDSEFVNIKNMFEYGGFVYLSEVNGNIGEMKAYKIDVNYPLMYSRPLNVNDMDLWSDVSLVLVEV